MQLKPSEIFYSQDSVNNMFDQRSRHSGVLIGKTLDDICEGRCSVYNIPTITVVERDGKWVTHDNRRLWVFRQLERLGKVEEIPVHVSYYIPEAKLTSDNGGREIHVRRNPGGYWHRKPSKRIEPQWKLNTDRKIHNISVPVPKPISPSLPLSNISNFQIRDFGLNRETSITKNNKVPGYGLQSRDSTGVSTHSVHYGSNTIVPVDTVSSQYRCQNTLAGNSYASPKQPNENYDQFGSLSHSTVQSHTAFSDRSGSQHSGLRDAGTSRPKPVPFPARETIGTDQKKEATSPPPNRIVQTPTSRYDTAIDIEPPEQNRSISRSSQARILQYEEEDESCCIIL